VAYQPPYTSFFTPRTRLKPEPAFLQRHTLTHIPQFSEGNLTTVRLKLNENTHHTIAFFYLAHDHEGPLPNTTTQQLIHTHSSKKLILGGDANSHHTQWGSTNTNERGELLYDYLLQSNLFICNKGNDPTFITRNRREVLDITLISDPLLNQLEAFKVGIEHSFSDHRYIEFTISLDCPPENITNLRLTNWGYYKNLLNRNLHAPPTHIRNRQELDNLVNTFTDICGEALKRACPSRTVKTKHNPPWWNATLAKESVELTSIELNTTIANPPGIYTIQI